jgi:alpha-ribazole phosphatase CobZ
LSILEKINIINNTLIIKLAKPVEIISSIPPGHTITKTIIFKTVPLDFDHSDYFKVIKDTRKAYGEENSPVFLTYVDIHTYIHENIEEPETHIFMTIGLNPPVCIYGEGYRNEHKDVMGTINILVITETPLSLNGLLDLFKTVTEAKTGACADLLLPCTSRSLGTVSDAIAVGRPVNTEYKEHFIGLATNLGNKIANIIYTHILEKGLKREDNELLKSFLGIDKEWIISTIIKVYEKAPIPQISIEYIRNMAEKELNIILQDPNIWSFIVAARELDLHGCSGTLPKINREEFMSDPHRIIADDMIGATLALYIAGFKGLFSMYWVERLKKEEKIFEEKGVFIDDIVSAIVSSILTRIYDKVIMN